MSLLIRRATRARADHQVCTTRSRTSTHRLNKAIRLAGYPVGKLTHIVKRLESDGLLEVVPSGPWPSPIPALQCRPAVVPCVSWTCGSTAVDPAGPAGVGRGSDGLEATRGRAMRSWAGVVTRRLYAARRAFSRARRGAPRLPTCRPGSATPTLAQLDCAARSCSREDLPEDSVAASPSVRETVSA